MSAKSGISPSESRASSRKKRELAANEKTAEDENGGNLFPTRDIDRVYASYQTVHCALHHLCVPCAYKVGCFDVALDSDFCRAIPNQRPENCPRLLERADKRSEGTLGYRDGMAVLTVGDGDFSFSLALAHLLSSSNETGMVKKVVASSYEKEETLRRVYPEFDETLAELKSLGATVFFEVDATRLAETLPPGVLGKGEENAFHRIVWNFPCTAISNGQDGQNQAMEENKDLVRKFVTNAKGLLSTKGGEIHMCHKTKPPYNQWKLEEVVAKAFVDEEANALYLGRVVLDKAILPPYTPRKALNRKSFPCHDACHYIFAFGITTFGTASEDDKDTNQSKFPRTIPSDPAEYPIEDKPTMQEMILVTEKLIGSIREAHMSTNDVLKGRARGKKQRKR